MKIKPYVDKTYKHDGRIKEDGRLERPFRIAVHSAFGCEIIGKIPDRFIENPKHIVDYAKEYFIMDARDQCATEKYTRGKRNESDEFYS